MKEVILYEAIDGKQFNIKDECVQYESRLEATKYKDSALLFNIDGTRLGFSDKDMNDAYFIHASTDEAAQFLAKKFGRRFGLPWGNTQSAKAGTWAFIDGDWVNAHDVLAIAAILNKIMQEKG